MVTKKNNLANRNGIARDCRLQDLICVQEVLVDSIIRHLLHIAYVGRHPFIMRGEACIKNVIENIFFIQIISITEIIIQLIQAHTNFKLTNDSFQLFKDYPSIYLYNVSSTETFTLYYIKKEVKSSLFRLPPSADFLRVLCHQSI